MQSLKNKRKARTIRAGITDNKSQGINWKVAVLNISNLEVYFWARKSKFKIAFIFRQSQMANLMPNFMPNLIPGTRYRVFGVFFFWGKVEQQRYQMWKLWVAVILLTISGLLAFSPATCTKTLNTQSIQLHTRIPGCNV